jgi:nucleotide-binding universal stress UspA family protein
MRRILVAIDGSDNSLRALDFAVHQARFSPSTELKLLTVLPPVRVYGEIEVYASKESMRELAARESRAILEAAAQRLDGTAIRFTQEQVEGDPAERIAERATVLACDSIVMGTHGRGRLGALLLGSVAQQVVHLATVPVTLVK